MTALETRINPANARSMALKSWEVRRQAALEKPAEPQQAENAQQPSGNIHARKIERLEAQLEQLDGLLDAAKTSADWRDLTNARTRLFEQWRVLSGIPAPGSRRPGREVARRAVPPADPTPANAPETS